MSENLRDQEIQLGLVRKAAFRPDTKRDQQRLVIDLTTARDWEELTEVKPADFLLVESMTGTAKLRFERGGDEYDLSIYHSFAKSTQQPIERLFLYNTAQPGMSLTLALGGDSAFQATTNPTILAIVGNVGVKNTVGAQIDPATEVTLAALLAATGGGATEVTLAALAAEDFATQTELAALNAKIPAAPATEGGNLATIAAKDFATQTELVKKVNKAGTPAIYNVTCADADTEYSQALPATTKKFLVKFRDEAHGGRLAFVTGKVAAPVEPYVTLWAKVPYNEDLIEPAALTLFLASPSAGAVAEIVVWS